MNGTSWAHVQEALGDFDFPATKEEIVAHAEESGDEEAVRLLRAMPPATYADISEIRSSVPLEPAADDLQSPARKAQQARSGPDGRVAEHLRDVDSP